MYEKPVSSALLPNSGVSDLYFRRLSVLCLLGKMHWDGGPRNCAATRNFQIFARGEAFAFHIRGKLLLHSLVLFLPAMVGKGSQVVKNEHVLLGIKLRWGIRIAGTPRRAVVINQLAKDR